MISFGLIYLLACDSDKGVVVYNTPPTVDIISHDNGSEVFEGYPVEFIAVLSDVNHDTDQLTARWKINGEEVCSFASPDEAGESVCVVTIHEGDEEIAVEVRDLENASGTDSLYVNIVPTEAPTASIIRPEETGIFYSDYPIIFEGMIGDVEDDVSDLIHTWSSSVDGTLDIQATVENDGTVQGNTYLNEGIHIITLRVEDRTEKTDTDDVTITVGGPNTAPSCEIIDHDGSTVVTVGEMIDFMALGQDADIPNSDLVVEWKSDKMEGILGQSEPNTNGDILFSYSDLTVDKHTVTMTVTDEKGAECTDFISVTVGTPPSVTIDSPTSGIYNEGDTITFSGTVSDNEDQPNEIALEWTTSDGSILNSQSATSDGAVEFVLGDMAYGQKVVTLTGIDTDGLTASDLVSFTINALPTQPSLTVFPENPKTGDDITATATSSTDADGGNVTYSYEWMYGSNIVSGSTLSSSETEKGQEWTVIATPNDGTADGPSVSKTVIIGNTAPEHIVVTITPSSGVYNDSELTCSATAHDVDTVDVLLYSYEWSTGDTTEAIILDGSLQPSDSLTCTATVTDGTEFITNSASVVLENRLPVVDSVALTPSLVYTNDTITAMAILADSDIDQSGDLTARFSWHVVDVNGNDLEVQSGTNNTLDGVSYFDRDDDVYVIVSPNDGIEDGISLSSNAITISNTSPVIDLVALSPSPAIAEKDDLNCEVVANDEDGDPLTYSYIWSNSTDIQQTTSDVSETTDTFLASGLNEDSWTCDVTPFDGTDYGDSVSQSILVENGCGSLYFDGIDDFINVGDPSLISSLSVITFGGWIKLSSLLDWQSFIGKYAYDSNAEGEYLIQFTSNFIRVVYQNATSRAYREVPYALPIDAWVHITSIYDGSDADGIHLFINGEEIELPIVNGTLSGPMVDSMEPLLLGARQNGQIQFFHGYMSQIGIYDRVLSKSEIQDMMVDITSVSGLVGGWNLDKLDSGMVRDISGNDLHGTVNGVTESNICPSQDIDEDGVNASEDCDDLDSSITTEPSGSSFSCASTSCKSILDDGYSIGDGIYWIDPDGNGPFEVYCDMTTEGGGWTKVADVNDGDCTQNFLDQFNGLNFSNFLAEYDDQYIFSNEVYSYEIGQANFIITDQGNDLYGFTWTDFLRWDGGNGHFLEIYTNDCHMEHANIGGFFSHCTGPFGPGFAFSQKNYCVSSWPNRQLYWDGIAISGPMTLFLK